MTYIQKAIGFLEIGYKLPKNYKIGITWQNYLNDDYVALNYDREKFFKQHPKASVEEVWNMCLLEQNPISLTERIEQVRLERQRLYRLESDQYYMAYVKYQHAKETEKADTAYTQWQNAIAVIDKTNPYPNE